MQLPQALSAPVDSTASPMRVEVTNRMRTPAQSPWRTERLMRG
jgi:hypothetical protein